MWGHGILFHSLDAIIMWAEDLSGLPGIVSGFLCDTEFSQRHQFPGGAPGLEIELYKGRQL